MFLVMACKIKYVSYNVSAGDCGPDPQPCTATGEQFPPAPSRGELTLLLPIVPDVTKTHCVVSV